MTLVRSVGALTLSMFTLGCSAGQEQTATLGGISAVGDGGSDSGSGGGSGTPSSTAGANNPGPEPPVDPEDVDGDGFTVVEGDCEDNSPQINPGAYDFPGNDYDEDCDGTKAVPGDEECDEGLAIDSPDPMDAARAIGLCKRATPDGKGWGVMEAKFTRADGTDTIEDSRMVGLLPGFGSAKVRAGKSLLALSSGVARAPGQPGYTTSCDSFSDLFDLGQKPPAGYPKENSVCKAGGLGGAIGGFLPSDPVIYDQAALTVKIRVPTNARSFAFDSIFYTYEYPDYICSQFNDFFVVFKEPRPEFVPDGNIVFDSNQDPIGVNNGLLDVCEPADQDENAPKKFSCSQGTALLVGSGFGPGESTCAMTSGDSKAGIGGASTGWLNTTAPAVRGAIVTLTFAVWDTGDGVLDSTALIDHFVWSVEEPKVETVPIVF